MAVVEALLAGRGTNSRLVVGRGGGVADTEPRPYSMTTSRYESPAAVVAQVAAVPVLFDDE